MLQSLYQQGLSKAKGDKFHAKGDKFHAKRDKFHAKGDKFHVLFLSCFDPK